MVQPWTVRRHLPLRLRPQSRALRALGHPTLTAQPRAAREHRQPAIEQLTDACERHISRWPLGDFTRVVGVMALARKNGSEPLTPDRLHCREDAQLVIDHHILPRRVTLLDRGEHPFLVKVDKHPSL